jgi:hypothetical protein
MNHRKSIANLLAAASLGSMLLGPAIIAWAGEEVRTSGAVTYVSGGVATDSINRLTDMAKDFNLKLVFAMKSGEYLSDVKVSITDATGRTVLDAVSEGPWFLARLPQGNYRVTASSSGNAIAQRVMVDGGRLSTVDFRWSSE